MPLEVKKKCCGQCLFTKNKIVSDERKQTIIEDSLRADIHFICHKATIEGKETVCAGWFQRYDSQMIRIARRLGAIKLVD